jgi:maltose alpha-D-glucosyltransferase/alpha-amylase
MIRFLSERAGFDRVPPFAGSMVYRGGGSEPSTLAMLQGVVENEGDGWTWTLEELDRYYEQCARVPLSEATTRDHVGLYLDAGATLGRRTGEMHLALASCSTDAAFVPEPLRPEDVAALAAHLRSSAARSFDKLKENLSRLPDDVTEQASLVLSRRRRLLDRFRRLESLDIAGHRIRVHGDYHLGQVLRARNDFLIVDFEGEPARSIAERRAKHSPLKDVAGMLRSFSYAAYAALLNYNARRPEFFETLEPWARLWEQAVTAEFLREYHAVTAGSPLLPPAPAAEALMEGYLLDKALYELGYELDNRPAWVRIPLWGILSIGETA